MILALPISMNATYITICSLKLCIQWYRVMPSEWDKQEINLFERAKQLLLGQWTLSSRLPTICTHQMAHHNCRQLNL